MARLKNFGVSGMRKLLCFHGFLGAPKDFNFLKSDFDVRAVDLSDYVHLGFDELWDRLEDEDLLEDCDLLGYSFGARLAARIYLRLSKKPKLVMLAGHLGLENNSQKEERRKIEQGFKHKLETLTQEEFIEYWNGLELFWKDPGLAEFNFKNADAYFKTYGLSEQPYLKQELVEFSDSILIYYGEDDHKYVSYAKENLSEFNVRYIPQTSHRLISYPEVLLPQIKEFLCN